MATAAPTKTLIERFMSTYGIAVTMGTFGAMTWHHFNRYQFRKIHTDEEENYREAGRPKHLKREIGAKWSEYREKELFKQFKYCSYVASVALVMSLFTRIVRLRKKTFRLSFNPYLPPMSDNAISFTAGAVLVDVPYYTYHLWEKEKIQKWRQQEMMRKNLADGSAANTMPVGTKMMA